MEQTPIPSKKNCQGPTWSLRSQTSSLYEGVDQLEMLGPHDGEMAKQGDKQFILVWGIVQGIYLLHKGILWTTFTEKFLVLNFIWGAWNLSSRKM